MKRRTSESGYAMLMVFVLASAIAIALYLEMPRVMFERQRQKEQLLIDRGEQYSLAVRRFYNKFQKWPATMDDLENTNNMRFLRRRFKDPMTGKDDWRIVHEAAGVLTDSLVHPPQQQQQQNANGSTPANATFGTLTSSNPTGSSMSNPSGTTGSEQAPPMAPGLLFRPSDRGPLGTAHGGVSPEDGGLSGFGSDYQSAGVPPSDQMGTDTSGQNPAGDQTAQNNNPGAGQNGNPGQNLNPGLALNGGSGTSPIGMPGTQPPGVPPNGFSPLGPGATGPNPAINQIQQSLFGPRPTPGTSASASTQSPLSGGGIGIAGVASSAGFEGIKTYHDQRYYKKWEFTFDMSTLQQMQQQQLAPAGTPQPGANSPFGQPQPTQQPVQQNPTPPSSTIEQTL